MKKAIFEIEQLIKILNNEKEYVVKEIAKLCQPPKKKGSDGLLGRKIGQMETLDMVLVKLTQIKDAL